MDPELAREAPGHKVENFSMISLKNWKLALLAGVALTTIAVSVLIGPISQDLSYHSFADQRMVLGIPNFWNVLSNLSFLGVGALGLRHLLAGEPPGGLSGLRPIYLLFFIMVFLTGCGSIVYHLHPTNGTLVWDRLPMTAAFAAFFAAVIGEGISVQLARRLLAPMVALGIATVPYWYLTESQGRGDLRPYVLVQILPMVLAPMVLTLFRPAPASTTWLWGVLGAYAAAKVAEVLDTQILHALVVLSGHTLKHIFAAFGAYLFLAALRHRRPQTEARSTF
jgi:hypothetical protein